MFRYALICFGVLACVCAELTKEQKEEIHQMFQPVAMKCVEELSIPEEDLEAVKASKDPKLIDSCFFSCMFKAHGLLDDKGIFDKEKGSQIAAMYVKEDDKLDKIKKVGDICSAVNDEKVSDGDKGCDRAILLLECFRENKIDFSDA